MNLSQQNPQKKYVKIICEVLYYFGVGHCWYETMPRTKLHQRIYQIWMTISNFYIFSFTLNEFLANIRTDLDDREKNDLVQFMFAHTTINSKIICLYIEKKRILKVLERLLENNNVFVTQNFDKACVNKAVRLCVSVLVMSYAALLASTIDGVRAHLGEGKC